MSSNYLIVKISDLLQIPHVHDYIDFSDDNNEITEEEYQKLIQNKIEWNRLKNELPEKN